MDVLPVEPTLVAVAAVLWVAVVVLMFALARAAAIGDAAPIEGRGRVRRSRQMRPAAH